MLRQYGIVFILVWMLLLSACTINVQDVESVSVSSNIDIFEESEDDYVSGQLQISDAKILTRDEAGELLFKVLGMDLNWDTTFPYLSKVEIKEDLVFYIIAPAIINDNITTKIVEYAVEIHGLKIYTIPLWELIYDIDKTLDLEIVDIDQTLLTIDEAGDLLFDIRGIKLDLDDSDGEITYFSCNGVQIKDGLIFYLISPIYDKLLIKTTMMGEYAVEIHGLEIYDTIIPSAQSEWTLVYEADKE